MILLPIYKSLLNIIKRVRHKSYCSFTLSTFVIIPKLTFTAHTVSCNIILYFKTMTQTTAMVSMSIDLAMEAGGWWSSKLVVVVRDM